MTCYRYHRIVEMWVECLQCGLEGTNEVDETGEFRAGVFEYGECPNCGSYDVEVVGCWKSST